MNIKNHSRRIDAHVHFWKLDRGDYTWMTADLENIYRDFEPEHLRPYLTAANIDEIIIVQAAATIAETEFILKIADDTDFVSGVVGWVDLSSPEAPDTLARLNENPNLKGIRPMIQDIPDHNWMLRDTLTPGLQALGRQGLSFDCLVRPLHLKNLLKLLNCHPDLRVIINHCAKPDIANESFDSWAIDMKRLADQTSAFCKFSGLVTEAGANWDIGQLRRYTDHVLQCFGPERLIFGSDWPVVNLAGDYYAWLNAANDLLSNLSDHEQAKVFGENAILAYDL
tara:strand:+ start:16748 stop:17593 length:846 start_codon:yes stop_codon:yes gene_type:complete